MNLADKDLTDKLGTSNVFFGSHGMLTSVGYVPYKENLSEATVEQQLKNLGIFLAKLGYYLVRKVIQFDTAGFVRRTNYHVLSFSPMLNNPKGMKLETAVSLYNLGHFKVDPDTGLLKTERGRTTFTFNAKVLIEAYSSKPSEKVHLQRSKGGLVCNC